MKILLIPLSALILFAISIIGMITVLNNSETNYAKDLVYNLSPWIGLSAISGFVFWGYIIFIILMKIFTKRQ